MFEHIGEVIRANVFANIPWITRAAGLTDPATTTDGGAVRVFPAARAYDGAPCDAGEFYVNMSPQEGETAIAFVQDYSPIKVVNERGRWRQLEAAFSVVVWYDERRILVNADSIMFAMQSAIITGVLAANYDTDGLHGVKARFSSITTDPARVWQRYDVYNVQRGLLLRPYRTFEVEFGLTAQFDPACFTSEITAQEPC